jgi:fructose-specific phosphotransferase system IIC component
MAKFSKKEKLIFWMGLSAGIVGGVVGNFWVSSYFNMITERYSLISIITFSIFSLFFVGLIIYITKIIKKINSEWRRK